MNDYSLRVSEKYFNSLEGILKSELFGMKIPFAAKNCEELYAERCAEHFEKITPANLKDHTALYSCMEALCEYVADLIEENDFDLGEVTFDSNSDVSELIKLIEPEQITFERFKYLSDEECPAAYSMKFIFKPVPDEIMEIALHGDEPVYAGSYRKVSPWNENLAKKKYNYLKGHSS